MDNAQDIKITSEDIFDEKKFILDDSDKKRIEKNIDVLKKKNIPYLEYMRTIPINSVTVIKSVEEIINKMLVDYVLACVSTYAIGSSYHLIGELLDKLNKKYGIDKLLSIDDKKLIIDIINEEYLVSELEVICYRFESVNVCMWALGFVDKPVSNQKADIKDINRIIFKAKNYQDLVSKSKLRSKDEILEFADLISRYYWALREFRTTKSELDNLNEDIVDVQEDTVNFITSYSLESLSKEYLRINCEKGDLRFEFMIPSNLAFDTVGENTKEMLALKSNDEKTRIVMKDLGKSNKYDFELKTDKYVRLFKDGGFEVINSYYHSSSFMEEKFRQLIIKKGSIALNVYFMLVCNHLIRLDSLASEDIDAGDYKDNINSKNTNIDLDIIFSIKEVK